MKHAIAFALIIFGQSAIATPGCIFIWKGETYDGRAEADVTQWPLADRELAHEFQLVLRDSAKPLSYTIGSSARHYTFGGTRDATLISARRVAHNIFNLKVRFDRRFKPQNHPFTIPVSIQVDEDKNEERLCKFTVALK